jgi:hypothetical protein
MTRFAEPSFVVPYQSEAYRENFDDVFKRKGKHDFECEDEECPGCLRGHPGGLED